MTAVGVWEKLVDAAPVLALFFGAVAVCGGAWWWRTRPRPPRYPARHGLGADAYSSPFADEIAARQLADSRDDSEPLSLPMQNPWGGS